MTVLVLGYFDVGNKADFITRAQDCIRFVGNFRPLIDGEGDSGVDNLYLECL